MSQRVADQVTPLMERGAQIDNPKDLVAAQKDLLQYQTDNQIKIWTTLAQATLALAAAIGGYFTYRNLRVTPERLDVDRQAEITNRFTQAITQLGAELKDGKPNLEVRLGGIYALERIAHDSPRDHWTIMEVLTAFVRQNAPWTPPTPPAGAVLSTEEPLEGDEEPLEGEQLSQLRTDIQAVLTVLGRRRRPEGRVEPGHLDLSSTDLRMAGLASAHLEGAILWGAHLEMAYLVGADLHDTLLVGANLWGAKLAGADLTYAHLDGAILAGADLEGADLEGAELSTALYLAEAQLKKAVTWKRARLPPDLAPLQYEDEKPADVSATALP